MNVITNNYEKCAMALSALKKVIDPEIGLNVVDLGLICQLDFDETENILFCTMTLTTQFCPMGESITDQARHVLQEAFSDHEIIVQLTFNPPWKHDRISEEGRKFLNV